MPAVRWWDGQAWTKTVAPSPVEPSLPGGGEQRRSPDLARDSSREAFPLPAFGFAVAGALVGILVLGGVGALLASELLPRSSAAQTLGTEIGLWFGLGGTCVLASRRYATGSLVRDYGWRLRPADVGVGLLAAVGCLVAAGLVGVAFYGSRFAGSNTQIITNQHGNTIGVAVVTLIAAVGAPIFEELFFRGLLRQALASRLGAGAIWVQAVFFGLAHFQPGAGLGNVSVVAATAAIGVILGYVTSLTGRLGADTIAHGLFNLTVTISIIGVIR